MDVTWYWNVRRANLFKGHVSASFVYRQRR
jgi:hypothetical protein